MTLAAALASGGASHTATLRVTAGVAEGGFSRGSDTAGPLDDGIAVLERRMIGEAKGAIGGNQSETVRLLGTSRVRLIENSTGLGCSHGGFTTGAARAVIVPALTVAAAMRHGLCLMLFNSHLFLIGFLPLALTLYAASGRLERGRVLVLLAVSIVFYGWWDLRFVPFLLGGIGLNWGAARLFVATGRRAIITAAIVLDLMLLGLFKYADFFAGTFAALTGTAAAPLGFALPLGISFFTFHHIMYLADLRRGRAPLPSLDRYALYICFFPQAIAGPLSRWQEVGAQFGHALAAPGWERRMALAVAYIVLGLFEKIALGDPLGRLLDPVYAASQSGPVADGAAWLAPLFLFQVFFDFAGYSNIAIGLALLFGVVLPANFDRPFQAPSILAFWQRWHMTLGRFLRDYVFLRLADWRIGRYRHTAAHYAAAIVATMGLCGLWHGAGWHFVVWGLAQGLAMLVALGWRRRMHGLPPGVGWALTIMFCLLSSVLFRAGSIEAAINIYASLGTLPTLGLLRESMLAGVVAVLAIAWPASHTLCPRILTWAGPAVPAVLGLIALVLMIQMGNADSYDFIYFQF